MGKRNTISAAFSKSRTANAADPYGFLTRNSEIRLVSLGANDDFLYLKTGS
jgi:hypothetical protein